MSRNVISNEQISFRLFQLFKMGLFSFFYPMIEEVLSVNTINRSKHIFFFKYVLHIYVIVLVAFFYVSKPVICLHLLQHSKTVSMKQSKYLMHDILSFNFVSAAVVYSTHMHACTPLVCLLTCQSEQPVQNNFIFNHTDSCTHCRVPDFLSCRRRDSHHTLTT